MSTVGADLDRYLKAVDRSTPVDVRGRVKEVVGLLVRAWAPEARIGELCLVYSGRSSTPLKAEVVGFEGDDVLLMPLGPLSDIGPASEVTPTGHSLTVKVSDKMLGRVLDGLGEPLDGRGPIEDAIEWEVERNPPDPMTRRRVLDPLATGVRSIDGLLTCGEGQRVGLFAAAGGGKSTLMGMIARNTDAEINVITLVGERGREVRDFLDESLGEKGLARSVVVCATSDQPSLVRLKAAYVGTAIAEYFRDRGRKVMLMMDSVTRFARAKREIGLACGEPPARQGYTPSVFTELPRLLERTGNSSTGSITAFYTVLVAGDDMNEPVADEVRSILDGHVVLSRALAAQGHYPAVDVLHSVSRVMSAVAEKDHLEAAVQMRRLLSAYEEQRDLILLGAYEHGSDATVDEAIEKIDRIRGFLQQRVEEETTFESTLDELAAAV